MEILVTARLKYMESSLSDSLYLAVKFKVPNKRFRVKREVVLCNKWWIGTKGGYKNYDEYQDDLIYWTSNKNELVKVVENTVKKYFEGTDQKVKKKSKHDLFKKQLREQGKIKVKVKID